jgi:hypothetical protein
MKTILTVVEPFGDYAKGAVITDADAIKAVFAADQGSFVVRTPAPPEPPAKPDKAPDPA